MANLLAALIVATWVVAIAIISVQNFASVSLRFLFFQSIEMPFGVVLAFSVALGVIGTAIAQLLWVVTTPRQTYPTASTRYDRADQEDDLSGDW